MHRRAILLSAWLARSAAPNLALQFADLQRVPEGLRITIRRSKTDPDDAGASIAIPEGRRLRSKALPWSLA